MAYGGDPVLSGRHTKALLLLFSMQDVAWGGPQVIENANKSYPRVFVLEPRVEGKVNGKDALSVANSKRPGLEYCYSRVAREDPGLWGGMELVLDLNDLGAVRGFDVTRSSIMRQDLAQCIVRIAKRWVFPVQGPAKVVFPLAFTYSTIPPQELKPEFMRPFSVEPLDGTYLE